ncbi:uncharacterized protein LOC127022570 [Gymnogyps californianus]|uniref:uncharacterized protein LOC127022570 n=1 Tax=Gymnogyps californianus TaxID=33616 RepID=UPI0021C991A0|nr:uncharacterized protein LOC127022570 [Gymnogyps californianus]
MGLHAIILLCAVVAGASGRSLEHLSYGASCFAECVGHSASYFPKRARYSYRYSAVTNTFLQGSIYKSSGISLESTAIIEVLGNCQMVLKVQDVQIKKSLASREESLKEMDSLRVILEQHPLHFSFHDGKVLKLCPVRSEQTWALNIKRGILSVLQTSQASTASAVIEEVDVLGICPTRYQRKGPILVKTRDLNLCSHRYSGFTSVQSVVLPHMSSEQQILSSKLECVQSIKDGVLAEAKCTESNLVTLFSQKGSRAKTQTQSSLKLFQVETETLYKKVDSEDLYVTSMLYEREETKREVTGGEVTELAWKLCLAHSASFETADLFMTLVFELRHLSLEALKAVWQRSSFKCRDNWQPLIDALPSCATEACVVLMKEIIASREVEEDKAEYFFWSFSFIPKPTSGMIESLAPLLKSPGASQSCFLGVTALLHRFCSAYNSCDGVPAVQSVMRTLGKFLGGNCTVQDSERLSEMQLVLKAIGNAGLAAASLAPILSLCASLKSNPVEIRLAAIQAFRRIPCSVRNALLVQLYQATSEDVEIRIAAYYIAMKCPHEELFKQVQKTLLKETSSQVGSFVWSHLSQLLETDDPLKEHLRDSIPDEILSRDFDRETWKYSSYSDVTFHSAGAGANMEASVVFSPASFLPRSVMTNLTIHLMGQAINLLEVGVRLENAEALMQKISGEKSATFSDYFFSKTNERNHKSENPVETTGKVKQRRLTSKQYSPADHLVTKSGKPKLRKANQNCPGRKYSKMSELVKKFTERTVRKEALKCQLSMKIFGNELSFLDCEDLRKQMKHYSLNLAELAVKLLKGQEVQFNKRLSLATEELQFPAISGFPVQLAVNASAAINIKIKGNADFKQQSNFFLNGYVKPSAFVQLSVQMGTVGTLGQAGLSWLTGVRTSTSLDGGIQVKKGQELKVFLNTPEESMEIINFSSKLYFTMVDEREDIDVFQDHVETRSCTREEVSEIIGWQLCSEMSYPDPASSLVFPLTGPLRVAITLTKQDRGLQQYVVEAAYNYIPQENSWIPNEAVLHFFIGTPKSDLKRDVGVDLNFSVPEKKFRIRFIQPKKKIEIDGRIEFSKNSRIGHLELIVDDRDVYYIKGMTELQMLSGEQRYMTQLEVKLIKQSSPIILSGNITKQLGKKIAFSVSLNNLLKDAAFLSAFLEKKVGDKLRQYSLEGETFLPGVLGVHIIGLLQQREGFWSHGLKIKYGLLGEAKNLHHECSMRQKIEVETGAHGMYNLDIGHEFHCMQTPTYNHKVHLKHEANASWLSSQMEVNYGKHWDEINNKKKLMISQAFKNSSSSSLVNYFMEFTMQVLEKQVNYRTQLQHSHNSQVYLQSSTNFEVQYNDHVPFMAGLQWKDASRNGLKKWEGGLNIDTPWLYLYAAHKLHQPQHSAYLLTMELTTRKALSIKNLVVELFYKDQGNEKEGKVHIYTPATTYLQASTFNHLGRNSLHSYSEMMSLWNQLVKNEIHLENNERAKFLCFKIKSTKQEFNFTASYQNLPMPKKTNFSVKTVWRDYKSLPVMLQFEGQIEELKKMMLYQKRGTLHFRHPFKVPILQSFLLQETFTVDKKQKHYFLETKVLINGKEETVQTLTLGYQPENPYICAGLTHPYNYRLLPKDVEICILAQSHQNVKQELETTLKVNNEDVLSFLGRYQDMSSEADFRHLLHMDVTHSFQLEFPQAMGLSGELFSKQTKMEQFDYGVNVKAIINKNVSSQVSSLIITAQAALKSYGESNFNGSLYLHSNGRDMLMLEVDMNNENRRNARVVELRAFLHQTILTNPESIQFQLMGKMFPSRLLISSEMKLNENRLHMDFMGAREQKVGFVLSLNGRVQHTFAGLKAIPHLLSLNGLLKCKNNIHDGNINMMVNKTLYGLRLRNRNVFGNTTVHNIAFAMFQNGSQAIPMEAKLKGHLELSKEMKRGLASFQVDEKALSVDFSNIMSRGHSRISGTFTHNISFLKNAGMNKTLRLPLDGILTAMCDHGPRNHTITIALQSGSERITAVFGGHRLSAEPPKSQLSVSLKHNISKIKKHGIPFIVEAAGYYENFTKKIAAGLTTTVEMEQLKIEIEKKTTGSAMEISLSLHHDVGGLMDIVPCVLEVACSGESANNQLSGLCNGAITFHHFETPARVSLNGSMFTSNFTVIFFGHVSFHDVFACLQLYATTNIKPHLKIDFQHSLPSLQSLGIARENQVKVSAMRSDKYKGMLGIVLGPCSLKADGEVSLANNETDTKWVLTFRNKCVSLEDLSIPTQSRLTGFIQKDKCQAELLCVLETEGKTARLEVRAECKPKITLEIQFRHDLPQLKEIPRENKLTIMARKQLKYYIGIGMKSGACELQMNGDFDPEKKLQWKMFIENKCQTIQDLGAPIKIDGSGYVLMDKMNLDSQTLITVDESKLQGLLILKVTDERQELDAVLTHNIQGAADVGIPVRMLVDVISEKTSNFYKRLIHFCVNSKQITEELSFVQKLDVVSLNYKLTHNIEALKTWQIKDRIELQAILNLKVIKSFSMKVHYDAHLTVLEGQIQEFETSTNISGNFHHTWPWLLQARVPSSLQIDVVFQGRNTTQERYMHIVAGETSITYIINSYYVGHRVDIFCQSVHSSEALQASGYPKAINLTLSSQKSENKAKTICEIQYDDKDITVTMDVDTDFQLYGIFEFMAEVKHSISLLHHLGLPFFLKMTIQEVLTENEIEGALRLTYEQNTNFSFTISRKKDQQGEELNIKALQTHPFFLQYFPSAAELSSKVNYDMSEAKGKLYLRMEKRDFNVTAKLTFTGTSYTNVIEIIQTMSQLKILPRQLVFMMAYQKGNRTRLLRHIAVWDGKEVKVTGTYTGLFPKLSGGHDVQVELFHPLSIPFPWHARVNLYVKHSARSHRDDLTVIWNEKDQISVSSSLKFGRDRTNYRATVAHPFNYTLKQLEVHSLSERRGRKYNQQLQLTGNGGQPADIRLTLEDKSKMNITAWDGCMTLSSGQLQRVLSMEHLHACGSLEQRSALFNEYLDLNWDDKKFKHNLTYERNQFLYPDKFQFEAVLENIFLTSCAKQKILGKMETNYSSCLDYYMSFEFCDLPNVIVFSGKHRLNKDDIILQSEGRFHLADHGRDEGLIGVSLKNQSTVDVKNYSLEIELRAFEDTWLGLTGTATSSSVQSQILVEGIIDQKEKVKVAASKGKECFQYYMGYLKGDLEEGMEVSACTDGQQMATINTYLNINGERQENMGQMTLAAVNGSLSFLAHGCGNPVLKAEYKLNEIGSLLKAKLMEKMKKFDGYMWRFRRSVQQVDFLSEAAGWPSIALQKVAGFLHSVGRAVAQVWKQSGIRQILRSKLPLYLDKIQDIVQQMQNELQKPVATLKDAYYDVTLKPLDEVWQEKTEEYMKKIQAFLPKIVKDVWLMEPIQVALKVVKAGLDMTTQQMLRWAEAVFSRAVSKIRKPLLNLYSFSARNCSVAVKLPVLPKADRSLDLANVTNYLIEEKLMRPLQDLYNINIVAEYYRFKRRMMESPFEYHAMLMGTKHLMTFDGKIYDLTSKCSVLLAKDFVHNTFTVILNEDTRNSRSLYVEMNQTVISIYPRLKISKMYNFSFMEENCQVLDQSLEKNTTNSRRETNKIEVSNQKGVSVSCDFQYDLCTVTLAGWHHGISAGLFGTNDNEAGNEWILPNRSFTDNVQEFTQSWQGLSWSQLALALSDIGEVSSSFSQKPPLQPPATKTLPCKPNNRVILFSQVNKCSLMQKKVKPCPTTAKQNVCEVFFEESNSLLRNCFKVVDPEPFYSMCTYDTCESQELKAACSLAAAFVHLCNRNFVPVEIPPQWFFIKLCLHWIFCVQYLL